MVTPVPTLLDRSAAPSDDQPTLLSAPLVYAGRYQIEIELGRGGMGRVLRARDLKIGRLVAVKVLARAVHDEQHRLRFEQEARAAGALNHPNIVAVHDIAEHEGEPFIVSELLEGETLRTMLSRGPLAPPVALALAPQLAEGLAAAHAKGIVHRDIKPENLFVTHEGRLKILDFGIAKLAEKQGVQTDTGATMGTPGYMSPEQVRGQPADARSDVFAFGAVLHEMLTGQGPFNRETSAETGYAILHDPPPSLPASTPPPLARLVGRCLQKDPAARYANAGEILHELAGKRARFELHAPLRRRWALPLAVSVAVVATAIALSRFVPRGGQARIESLAVLPLENRSGEAQQEYLADGMTDALIDELSRIRSLRVVSRTSAMVYKGARKSLPQIARELSVDAVIEGSVASAGGRIRLAARLVRAAGERMLWSNTYDAPIRDVLAVQSEMASAVTRELNAALTPEESGRLAQKRTVDPAAWEQFLQARYEFGAHQTCDGYERTRALLERAIAADPGFAEAHAQLAYVWGTSSWMTCVDPKIAAPKARSEAQRALELDASSAKAHSALSQIAQVFDGDPGRAEKEARRAVELAPSGNADWCSLAGFLVVGGRFEEGAAAARRGAALDPLEAGAHTMCLGWALYAAGHYEEAIAAHRRALELDPKFLYAHLEIGWNLVELGRVGEALEPVEKARTLLEPGKSCLDDTMVAGMLAAVGKRQEALVLLLPWEARAEKEYVDGYQLAYARAQLGDKDAAVRWMEMAWRQHSPSFVAFQHNPYDLDKKAWLAPLKGDPRIAELIKRPRAP